MDLFRRIFGQSGSEEETPAEENTLPLSQTATPKSEEKAVNDTAASTTTETADDEAEGVTAELSSKKHEALVSEEADTATESGVVDGAASPSSSPYVADGATRPLSPEKVISTDGQIIFGVASDVGMVRPQNQDAAFTVYSSSRTSEDRPDFGLFVVADGMGGHHEGEKASAISARIVAEQVTANVFLPILSGQNDSDRPPITEVLIEAVQQANKTVIKEVPDGGTTLTSVTIIGDLAHVVHVGDSRMYMISKDGIEQITRDHSLVQRLIELDHITREEAVEHKQKNVLYRAIGQSENLEVDTLTRRLQPESRLLLCSDGLWGLVEDHELHAVIMENNPQEACDKLVALANTRGGNDNITAVILKIPK